LTCEPGGWTTITPTSFTYTFQVDNASAQVLQAGASNVFAPPHSAVGDPIVCIVQATSPGGTSTARSGTTPPVIADTTPPSAAIRALKCHRRSCTLSFVASDPNGVALGLRATAAYTVLAKCPKKKGRRASKKVCHKTKTVTMSPKALAPAGSFRASASRLPYGAKLAFKLEVGNAAGLKARTASAHTTLHKPRSRKR
jgi:hypothetical protein